jgi:hypothetical protein
LGGIFGGGGGIEAKNASKAFVAWKPMVAMEWPFLLVGTYFMFVWFIFVWLGGNWDDSSR